jgi:hypothetical protein
MVLYLRDVQARCDAAARHGQPYKHATVIIAVHLPTQPTCRPSPHEDIHHAGRQQLKWACILLRALSQVLCGRVMQINPLNASCKSTHRSTAGTAAMYLFSARTPLQGGAQQDAQAHRTCSLPSGALNPPPSTTTQPPKVPRATTRHAPPPHHMQYAPHQNTHAHSPQLISKLAARKRTGAACRTRTRCSFSTHSLEAWVKLLLSLWRVLAPRHTEICTL